jgi:DNA-binding NarL/FixJ family response regulator
MIVHGSPGATSEMASLSEDSGAGYWETRLVESGYGKLASRRTTPEWSVRIEHEGSSFIFPLGTYARGAAAAQARAIYRTILREGWSSALGRYPRELTLAVVWAEDPMIFTYTTLYSAPKSERAIRPKRSVQVNPGEKVSVALIEAEEACSLALAEWLRSLPEYTCRGVYANGGDALRALERRPVDLVLFNRQLPDVAAGELARTMQRLKPAIPAFGYRLYSNSDELFVSQPGKSGGYYFRRRPPEQLLEPLGAFPRHAGRSAAEWHTAACRYVAARFQSPLGQEETREPSKLTGREQDSLSYLCQGRSDKGIADALKISTWTVHTHLKKIYDKLGVHSRTEAVIRYLQK